MAAILGIGCSRAPMILNPPEEWGRMRERTFSHVPGYQPPAEPIADQGQDQGLGAEAAAASSPRSRRRRSPSAATTSS